MTHHAATPNCSKNAIIWLLEVNKNQNTAWHDAVQELWSPRNKTPRNTFLFDKEYKVHPVRSRYKVQRIVTSKSEIIELSTEEEDDKKGRDQKYPYL